MESAAAEGNESSIDVPMLGQKHGRGAVSAAAARAPVATASNAHQRKDTGKQAPRGAAPRPAASAVRPAPSTVGGGGGGAPPPGQSTTRAVGTEPQRTVPDRPGMWQDWSFPGVVMYRPLPRQLEEGKKGR